MLNYISIEDPFDPRITQFRKEVCMENGATEDYIKKDMKREQTEDYYNQLPREAVFEEIWKFGNNKWQRTKFSRLECVTDKEKIVSISGCRRYTNNMLRVGMHHYTLRPYRKDFRNILFAKEGFFARHLWYSRTQNDIDCLFVSIYPHNRRLKSLIHNLAHRGISPDGGKENLYFVDQLIYEKDPIKFHDVDQYFFLYPTNNQFKFDKNNLSPLS